MTENPQSQLQHWQQLKQQAVDGDFHMEEGIGEALRDRCHTFLFALNDIMRAVERLANLSGYGSLPSAKDMKKKFEDKAVNGGDNGDSAMARIQEHMTIVELMRDTYAAAIGQLQNTDQDTAGQMTSTGGEAS